MAAEVESAQRRAAAAQQALRVRHLRRLGGWVPGTRIGRVAWPPAGRPLSKERLTASWNYWWQAHLVDVLVDGAIHRDDARCERDATALLRGIRFRNAGRWTNSYYDDMAWLGLAIERVERHLGPGAASCRPRALRVLRDRVYDAWAPDAGGGIPWRTTDTFFNAPANGPAAVLLSRTDRIERSIAMADWVDEHLRLPSGLIADGLWCHADGTCELDDSLYTYCQGVALAAQTQTYRHTGDRARLHRIDALLTAVADRFTTDGVIHAAGGGDGGLFGGILARYLAFVATDLTDDGPESVSIRERAAWIVTASADAAWANRAEHEHLPVFGHDWRVPAVVPTAVGPAGRRHGGAVASSKTPERDMSVQIAGTMLLEAAVAVTIGSPEDIVSTPG